MRRAFLFCFIFGGGGILQGVFAAQGVILQLPEKATVVGPQITLGEIAEVIGDDRMILDRLRRLTLGRAAPAGDRIRLSMGYVKVALRKEGYSLGQFTFEGADAVEVATLSQSFKEGELLPKIKDFILRETGESAGNVDVKLDGAERAITLPAGEVTANFRPSFNGRYEDTVFLTTELLVDGRLVRVLPIRVDVQVYHPMVTVSKRVEKGEKFDSQNVDLIRTPRSRMLRGCFDHLENVLGRTAARPLLPGTVIQLNDIYDPPAVLHGQTVQGMVEKGNIELIVRVLAVEDGKAGDIIRVENTETQKVLHAKVLDEKTVLIEPESSR